jgi:hypothetical protein
MAATTKSSTTAADDVTAKVTELTEETNKKVADLVEKAVASQKELTLAAIDSYEDSVLKLVDSTEKAVADSGVDWLKDAYAPQAKATRELTSAYVAAARKLVN